MTDQKTQEWRKAEKWTRHGKDFAVEVYHHTAPGPETFDDGLNRWNVYAYVYPNHPHFAEFKGADMWQEAATAMPFHGGPSYLQWFMNHAGNAQIIKVGSDYHHLGDDGYTVMASPAEAWSVFNDADKLYDWLAARAQGEK